ncbi:MAG: 30S ribosomal protein S13 [Lentisphaerae bacterium GWF2_45_14]|nr:MAG: 30S ribosomal protein S13 [Lentisphaerae bacterium GWF2_45_14]
MPRIIGIDIPGKKRIEYALCYIYGIGPTMALEIIRKARIKEGVKAEQLTDENIAAITTLLQTEYLVEGDLRRKIGTDIRRLQSINCYRGIRHKRGLPVRGQRTKTNARTRKGRKQTVGAIRDKSLRKVAGSGPSSAASAPASKK